MIEERKKTGVWGFVDDGDITRVHVEYLGSDTLLNSQREGISRYCVLLKAVPDNVDGNTIRASLKNVKKSYRYNEFRSNVEVRWIVQFHKEEDASCILRQTSITLSLFSGGTVTVSVGKCPEDIIPEEWLDGADLTWSKTNHKKETSSVDHTFSNNGSLSSNTQSEPVNGQDQSQRECGSPDVFDWGTSGLTTSSERNGETSSLVDGPNPTNQSGPSYLPKNTHSGDFTVYQNAETFIIRTEALQEPINEVPPKLPERKPHPKSSHSSSTSASAPQGGKVEPSTEATLSRPGFPVSGQQVGHSIPPREEVISSPQYGKYNESFVTAQENFDSSRISDCLPEAPGDRGHFGMGQGPPDQPPYPFQPQQFGPNVMVCPPGPMPQPPNFASGPIPSLPNYHYGMGMYPPYGQAPLRPPFEGAYPTPQGIFPEPGQLRNSGDWNPASFPPYNPPQHDPQPAPPTVPAENLTDPKSIVLSASPVADSEGQAKGVPPKRSPKSATRSKKTEKKKEKKEKGAPAVAKRVLEKAKSHKIGKAEVQIFAFNPEKENFFEEKVLLVTGLKDTTTTECLENYLEARCDDNLEEILYGDEGGKAVVVFEKAPDFKKLITSIKGKSLEGQKLEASRVKRCHSVCVCGIDGNITDDCLELFFENKRRSGGGQVERLDLQYDIGICIVFFKNSSDADNVWRNHRSVTVSGLSLQVKPYYPCLGLPRELAQVTIEKGSTPQIMIKDLSSYVVRFLSTSKSLKGKFDEDLKGHNAKVIWSGAKDADSMDIHCTYQVGTKLSKNTLEKWKVEAEKIVRQFLDDFTAKKLQSSSDAWKSLIEFLRTVSIDEPDKVGVILEKEQCCVVVVGWKDNVEKLGKVIQNNIKTREEKIVAKKSHVTKSCSLQPHQVMILERLQFHKNTAKSFTDVEVKMNASEKTVTFTGPKSELDKAVLKMHEILNSLTTKSFSVSQVFIELLDKEEAQKAVHDTLKSRKLQSAWVTKPKETSVEVYGVNPSEINQAMSAIRDTLPEKNFDLKDNLREFLRSEEWRGCVKKLTSHYNGKMAIVSSDQLVSFAAITDIFNSASEEIQNQVEEFTRKHCSASDFLATNSAKKELEDMVKSIMEEKHKISEPGCVRFFGSEEGIKARQKAESDNKCIIKNTREDSEEQTVKRGGEKSGKGANFKRPEEVASCSSGGMTMKVMEGDMTQLSVDGIVNAANNDLDHCGGLAKVISDAGGPSIQKECDKYIKKYGKVSDGDAMYSSPGHLPCKWLIHAVGPRWSGGHRNEEIDLRKAITKCLELASEKNMTSLAIPALSAGIFGYPVDQATSVIIGTIVFYFKTREGKESSLKEIYLCGVDDKIIRSFIQSLQNTLGYKSVTVKRREGASYKEERDKKDHILQRGRNEGKSYKRQGIEVRLIKGELASQKADALVNSAHHSLDLSIGATSKSLLRVGGDKVQEECKLKYRSGIKPGQVAITKGGDLQCSQVYHGTLQKFTRDNYEQAMQTMEDFVGKCLETADTNQLKSIAFPALGTGQLGYPADLVAGTMYRCISQFEKDNPSTSLVEVQLVVYHKDTATIKAFEIKSKSRSTGVTDDDSERQRSAQTQGYHDRRHSSQGASSGRSSTIGKLEVKILQGNITTDGSDAIVNSVGERMDLSKGLIKHFENKNI
ncbi:hypothetical protein FSP39_011607 [Pinctada imbricata]|uniref:Macro domain-containing protein n=1 Tax=Pinctada imbricata TaxID=66713 RepID=A0AA88YEP2_PINIB|nr:hypothetical protein FSP39_011607 [Pinctada imbricata]